MRIGEIDGLEVLWETVEDGVVRSETCLDVEEGLGEAVRGKIK